MARKRVQKADSPQADDNPLLAKLEKAVTDILDNPNSSVRQKQTAVQLGIKLAQIKHHILGDSEEGNFFE